MASADLLLHPVRLRIVKAFLGDRALTTGQLAEELDDVPVASLYRHIARLLKAGVLQIVAEERIRGAVERTYTLRSAAAQMHPNEVAAMSAEDNTHAFMAFIAGVLQDFDRYVASSPADPIKDGAGYRLAAMWLSDAEYHEFLQELAAVIQPRVANAPKSTRRRRMLYGVALPDPGRAG
jgi:DNA-binding transcriptional ArsR family regulator